jgi:hypothetical protein
MFRGVSGSVNVWQAPLSLDSESWISPAHHILDLEGYFLVCSHWSRRTGISFLLFRRNTSRCRAVTRPIAPTQPAERAQLHETTGPLTDPIVMAICSNFNGIRYTDYLFSFTQIAWKEYIMGCRVCPSVCTFNSENNQISVKFVSRSYYKGICAHLS